MILNQHSAMVPARPDQPMSSSWMILVMCHRYLPQQADLKGRYSQGIERKLMIAARCVGLMDMYAIFSLRTDTAVHSRAWIR